MTTLPAGEQTSLSATRTAEPGARSGFEPACRAVTPLAAGEVHVWRADLTRCAGTRDLAALCEQELARAQRFASPTHGARWAQARAILRLLLARYSGLDARALRLEAGAHGKPALAQSSLAFNLSHSGDLALYAFSATAEVGIDVELARPRTWSRSLAARAFGADQARRLLELPAAELELLRAWVRREATAKCSGQGIFARADRTASDCERTGDPEVIEIDLGAGAVAALACRPAAARMRLFDWPPRPSSPEDARIPFPA